MLFDVLGVKRSRVAVHNWYRRSTDSQLAVKVRIAFVDQKTIRINDEQYRLYSTVDPETNRIHHSRRFPSRRFRSHENTSPSSSRNTASSTSCFSSMTQAISSASSTRKHQPPRPPIRLQKFR